MNKKIIILNGSPRKSGNTAALTAAFTEGAKGAGKIVTALVSKKMIWIKFIRFIKKQILLSLPLLYTIGT